VGAVALALVEHLCYGTGMKAIMLRAKLTDREWTRIRKIALDRNVSTADLIGTALRESLLKGAKP
jgi:hypothetical protein